MKNNPLFKVAIKGSYTCTKREARPRPDSRGPLPTVLLLPKNTPAVPLISLSKETALTTRENKFTDAPSPLRPVATLKTAFKGNL